MTTQAELDFMYRVKTLPCIICYPDYYESEPLPKGYYGDTCSDFNHIVSGRKRLGHYWGFALCYDHHRGQHGVSSKDCNWDSSYLGQVELCRITWLKLGGVMPKIKTKVVSRNFATGEE